jgi:hypothetical protein
VSEFAGAFEIGSRVRSFDFESHDVVGPRACYIEGTLEALVEVGTTHGDYTARDCARYAICVDRVVFAGVESLSDRRIGHRVYPPANGTPWPLTGGYTHNVESLPAAPLRLRTLDGSIEIEQRWDDYKASYVGQPGKWGCGPSPRVAIGSLKAAWPRADS